MYVLVWEKTGLLLSLTLMIFAMTAEAQERKTGASSEDTANSVPYRAMADSISRTPVAGGASLRNCANRRSIETLISSVTGP